MNENKDKKVALAGHTDNIGTEAYNMGLSNRRWMSVRDYVVKHGVDSSRVSGQGFGASKPIASNATAEVVPKTAGSKSRFNRLAVFRDAFLAATVL